MGSADREPDESDTDRTQTVDYVALLEASTPVSPNLRVYIHSFMQAKQANSVYDLYQKIMHL